MKSLKNVQLENKKVIVRVDFNVPLDESSDGFKRIADDTRIKACLPTINFLIKNKAKIILISHLGRPEGKQDRIEFSLDPAILSLQELLGSVIHKVSDIAGEETKKELDRLKPGELMCLANLRFDPGEKNNDEKFAQKLASLGDIYVNDAFSVSHRPHASVDAITKFLPSYPGLLFEQEYHKLIKLLSSTKHPFVLLLGGAKPKEKIPVIQNLLKSADKIILGGVIANTFISASGYNLGQSKVDKDTISLAQDIIKACQKYKHKCFLPVDLLVQDVNSPDAIFAKKIDQLSPNDIALDIGPDSTLQFLHALEGAETIFWNGTMGLAEKEMFAKATNRIIKQLSEIGPKVIVAGGDTLAAIEKSNLKDKFINYSLGGGASLEFLAGKKLPGIVALEN